MFYFHKDTNIVCGTKLFSSQLTILSLKLNLISFDNSKHELKIHYRFRFQRDLLFHLDFSLTKNWTKSVYVCATVQWYFHFVKRQNLHIVMSHEVC